MVPLSLDAKRLAQLVAELVWRSKKRDPRYLAQKLERNNHIRPENEEDAIFYYNQFDPFNQHLFTKILHQLPRHTLGRDELVRWCYTINEQERLVMGELQ